jgi:hypothetical protein
MPAGVTAVTVVEFTTCTLVAARPPTVTEVVPDRFVPVSVIVVPPSAGPLAGLTAVSVGASVRFLATRNPWKALPGTGNARLDDLQAAPPLFQLPPRNTRNEPELGPGGFTDGLDA